MNEWTRCLIFKSQAFDMMLADLIMLGKDGIALLEDLRSLGIALPARTPWSAMRSHLYKKCQALGIDLRAMRVASEPRP